MTGALQEDRDHSRSAGCDACIAKPLRCQELYLAVNRLPLQGELP